MFDEVDNEEIKGIDKTAAADQYYSEMLPRGYLSVSQVVQYQKCGEAYRRRYVLEQPIPTNSFQVQGRGVHKAAEMLHNSMIGGSPISQSEIVQVYSDLHDGEILGAIIPEDEGDEGRVKDAGVTLTALYHRGALGNLTDAKTGSPLPVIQPIAAEKIFRVELKPDDSDPIPFVGVIDLVEATSITDLKTKRKAASQAEADDSLQLSLYAHVTGKPDVRLDQLIKPTKKLPARYQRTQSLRTRAETLHALDIVAEVATDVAAGRFRRTNPENWWCTQKWCPYWGDCRGRKR
jgi:hypothetical protein